MVIPCPSKPWPYSGPRLYEFCIAVGPKQRRPTEAHCAWVGGVSLAARNLKSLTAGRKLTTVPPACGEARAPTSANVAIATAATATRRTADRADLRAMLSP